MYGMPRMSGILLGHEPLPWKLREFIAIWTANLFCSVKIVYQRNLNCVSPGIRFDNLSADVDIEEKNENKENMKEKMHNRKVIKFAALHARWRAPHANAPLPPLCRFWPMLTECHQNSPSKTLWWPFINRLHQHTFDCSDAEAGCSLCYLHSSMNCSMAHGR